MASGLDQQAIDILKTNDRGGYTIPTSRLYPYQWNWDSAFAALGFMTFDPARAWREVEMLFEGQWDDGMVPHILFRRDDPDYFPGPSVWQAGKAV
ncbi:MAG: MGH1-like glycoside hydrolase domain-containing protein, partial [Geminicoccaceae bacterium]